MTWLALIAAVCVLLAVLMLPGLLIGFVAGLRGHWLIGLAGPAGLTVVAFAAIAAPMIGVGWGLVPVLLSAVALTVVVLALRLLIWRSVGAIRFSGVRAEAAPLAKRVHWTPIVATAIPMVLIAFAFVRMIGAPENISQTFDNIFHLNGIRYAADAGNASPFFLASMTSGPNPPTFYPSEWHALGSLLVIAMGVSVPVASNALLLTAAAVLWPISIVLLARVFGGSRPRYLISAGALSAAMPAFPLLLADYGVLYPLLLGFSVVPAVLAVLVHVVGVREGWRRTTTFLVIFAGSLLGIAVSHPGAFVALLACSLAVVLVFAFHYIRNASTRGRVLISAAVVIYLGFIGAVWYVLRPEAIARSWLPQESAGQALGEVLTLSMWGAAINYVVAALLIVGIVVALRRRSVFDAMALGIFVVTALLYIVVSGMADPLLRDMIVGPWYNNAPRLAAFIPMGVVPLAAFGAESSMMWLARSVSKTRLEDRKSPLIVVALALVVLVLIPQGWNMRKASDGASFLYRYSPDAPLVSADERKLLDRLDAHVPEDATVVGSPWTGAALAYALADRKVLVRHTLSAQSDEDNEILNELNEAEPGTEVCAAVKDENATYVLDFGKNEVHGGSHVYPGLEKLGRSDAVELVDRQGAAKLYKVVGCG